MMIFFNLKGFRKNPNNWSLRWPWTWEKKWNFLHIHNFADSAAEWMNIYILGILMSYHDGSQQFKRLSEESKKKNGNFSWPSCLQFKRLSEKSKKLKFFMTADLLKNVIFLHIHIFADFAAKWVNFYFLGIVMSYYDDFLQLIRLSKK